MALSGCASLKEPLWTDAWTAEPLPIGSYELKPGRLVEVGLDRAVYREPGRGIVIEAADASPQPASVETRNFEHGVRYRITNVQCAPDWAPCSRLRSATHLYLVGASVERTPLKPGVPSRRYPAIWVSVTGGSMGFSGGYERVSN